MTNHNITISIITAVYNRAGSIDNAINSLQKQSYRHVEHIIIDGGSTDGTQDIIKSKLKGHVNFTSESDEGIYDALNKGLIKARGEIIGFLHSDDFFAYESVLSDIAIAFEDPSVDAVYGDLEYVSKYNPNKRIRHWKSGKFSMKKLKWGWMPPHPALFLRRSVIEKWGGFDKSYSIAADYDAILRYFSLGAINTVYIQKVLVKMRTGGESNRTLRHVWKKTCEDYRALRSNRIGGIGALLWKNLSKVGQFLYIKT
jgi:glycosyltransferase involved in cell wall biosynthesis